MLCFAMYFGILFILIRTPEHRKFIDAMLHSSINIIVTMRSKMETVQTNDGGKKKVEKLGLKAEQRDGIEYEFTTVLDITHGDNYAIATKDRTGLFIQPERITEQTGIKLNQWLSSGSADATINGNQILELEALMIEAGIDIEKYCTKRKLNSLQDVRQQIFDETCSSIQRVIKQKAQSAQESEKHMQQEQDALLEADYQNALAVIQSAESANDLQYPANYFKGSKYEQQILNACQAKTDMEGWSA